MAMTSELHLHPLFQSRTELLSADERVSLSYQRARLVMQTYRKHSPLASELISDLVRSLWRLGLTASDVQFCSPKFWALMTDPICSLDIAMFTILAAHLGLAIGTLSRYLKQRPDLKPLVNRLLRFDTVGIYLLTERGHGL